MESQDESIERQVQHMELVEQLHALLGQLSERQQIALKLSYGLDGQPPLRQYEVGSSYAIKRSIPLLSEPSYAFETTPQIAQIEVFECTPGGWHAVCLCLLMQLIGGRRFASFDWSISSYPDMAVPGTFGLCPETATDRVKAVRAGCVRVTNAGAGIRARGLWLTDVLSKCTHSKSCVPAQVAATLGVSHQAIHGMLRTAFKRLHSEHKPALQAMLASMP